MIFVTGKLYKNDNHCQKNEHKFVYIIAIQICVFSVKILQKHNKLCVDVEIDIITHN